MRPDLSVPTDSPARDSSQPAATGAITRREALRRAALFLGVAITPAVFDGALRAQVPGAPGGAAPSPRHLTPAQFAAVGAMAERILPRTDTPGALDAGVPAFIDVLVGDFMTASDKSALIAGLAALDKAAQSAHRQVFARLTAEQQDAQLTGLARDSQGKARTFFHIDRELTIVGYFTSEVVGKNVLHYDPVPGRYDGCIPLAEVGNRSWTR